MSWSRKFDEPIELAKGKPLRTLRDTGTYITALPKKEAALPHWQLAAQCLLSAAEKSGLVMMARIAMMRALHADNPTPAKTTAPRKKPAKKYRIVS